MTYRRGSNTHVQPRQLVTKQAKPVAPQGSVTKSAVKYFTPRTATSLIIANMIGVGVFTSLGLQLDGINGLLTSEIESPEIANQVLQDGCAFPLLMMWFLGGVAALTGAMSYAELGGAMPRSGGEYNFLGRIYHPSVGFVSGWISATVGFAAPIAAIAMAFSGYTLSVLPEIEGFWGDVCSKTIAVGLVLACTWFHTRNHGQSSLFQNSFTLLKIILIFAFCVLALILVPESQPLNLMPKSADLNTIFSSPFAVGLVYVSFSYSGWNAATYILGEMENPQADLPRVLITGTTFVTLMYVLLNFVFLKTAPVEAMIAQEEIGAISASYAFGDWGGKVSSIMFALLFISSVGAMTMAGPRAIHVIGEDHALFGYLGQTNSSGLPMRAIILQSAISVLLILTSSFKTIMVFAGFMLAFCGAMAVLGVIVLRLKEPDLARPYKTPLYPFVPIVFLVITCSFLVFTIKSEPMPALYGLVTIIGGFVFYLCSRTYEKAKK